MSSGLHPQPKRLIEVDLPIREISVHARREKSIRHGHISTLHLWWARRPLAACRTVLCASLWPDPADPACPEAFIAAAEVAALAFARSVTSDRDVLGLAADHWSFWKDLEQRLAEAQGVQRGLLLREAFGAFLADFANWDASNDKAFLEFARSMTMEAHAASGRSEGSAPLVLDPFAGGGAIPLEALRVGCDAIGSDLNPVAVLLNKVALEDIPRFGTRLVLAFKAAAANIHRDLAIRTSGLFPKVGGKTPIAYLFARTVLSEAPGGRELPIEIPLLRSFWLAKRRAGGVALRWVRDKKGAIVTDPVEVRLSGTNESRRVLRPRTEVVTLSGRDAPDKGTTIGGAATCPITGYTTPVESVRAQLSRRSGGTSDARLVAVVIEENGGKKYRLPTEEELHALSLAEHRLAELERASPGTIPQGEINHLRGFINIVLYGMTRWGHAFSARQAYVLATVTDLVDEAGKHAAEANGKEFGAALQRCLAMAADRLADYNSALCTWRADGEFIGHTFGQGQALPMRLDFVEVNPLSGSTGDWSSAFQWVERVCEAVAGAGLRVGKAMQNPAASIPLPDNSVDLVCTDPPYYAAVPYADLSDFFYSWLRHSLGRVEPELLGRELTPKKEELVSLAHRAAMYREKDGAWFEARMKEACIEARRVARPDGVGVWVFANKETQAWEAMLAALIDAGWIITASWPIDTEMAARLRARNSAALASSVHIVCRPREAENGRVGPDAVGDWRDVLAALPKRIHDWMPRLAKEGIVGADAIFACLGPALEVFSRYTRVEKASGQSVLLKEYLEHVWAVVAQEALAMIFSDVDATGFEEDARLTAMWLWTLSTGVPDGKDAGNAEDEDAGEPEEDVGEARKSKAGFVLEYDAARKIAQGFGAHLEQLTSLIEVSGSTARLLPVAERTRSLFRKGETITPLGRVKSKKKETGQLSMGFLADLEEAEESGDWGETGAPQKGETVLDRVHQSMILFGAGRGEALKRFLVEDGVGHDDRFWRLAQAFSALYPASTNEKRWIDGVLARKKSLGF